jgi:hypothetical protein
MAITKTDGATAIKRGPTPDFVTIYDEDGNAFQKFPVDARECVESGCFSYQKPETADSETEQAAEVTPEAEAPPPPVAEPKKRGRKPKGE